MYMPMAMPAMQVFQQDSWVVVPIHSVSRASHKMEGTRLTLVKVRKYWARTRMLLPGFKTIAWNRSEDGRLAAYSCQGTCILGDAGRHWETTLESSLVCRSFFYVQVYL